jgi:hypothetical protein
MAGVAVAGDYGTQSEKKVKETTTHSTTMQEGVNHPQGKTHESTTVEKQQKTTSDNMDGDTTTRNKVEVEKKSSHTTTSPNPHSSGATQEYRHQSETHHQNTTKEVEKK